MPKNNLKAHAPQNQGQFSSFEANQKAIRSRKSCFFDAQIRRLKSAEKGG